MCVVFNIPDGILEQRYGSFYNQCFYPVIAYTSLQFLGLGLLGKT